MAFEDYLKTGTLAGCSVGLWLFGINPKIPLPAQGIGLGLASVSSYLLLAHTNKLAKIAPLEAAARELQRELILEDLALSHVAQSEQLRRTHWQSPDPWGEPPPPPAVIAHDHGNPAAALPPAAVSVSQDEPAPMESPKPVATLPAPDAPPLLPVETLAGHYPSILIWGAQGSGKTSLAAYLIRLRIQDGYQVKVLDPHAEYGQWSGLQVIGAGMDYSQIDFALEQFHRTVKQRYQQRSKHPNCQFSKVLYVCEEFTNWASRCENAAEFFMACLSDIRKVDMAVLFISHSRTLIGLGGAKGVAQMRDNSLLEVQLFAKPDPQTGEAVPAMKGTIKLPACQPEPVAIAPWMKGQLDFSDVAQYRPHTPVNAPNHSFHDPSNHRPRESFQSFQHPEIAEMSESQLKRWEALLDATPSLSETSEMKPERAENGHFRRDSELLKLISDLKRKGLNQTQIIWEIWREVPGGSKGYQDAVATYKRLMGKG